MLINDDIVRQNIKKMDKLLEDIVTDKDFALFCNDKLHLCKGVTSAYINADRFFHNDPNYVIRRIYGNKEYINVKMENMG